MAQKSLLEFTKMTGAGNDFLIIDGREPDFAVRWQSRWGHQAIFQTAQLICDRHFGLGADGLVIVRPPSAPEVDFAWEFYNSDGSPAEMCGNAARCVARWAQRFGVTSSPMTFATLAGPVRAEILADGRTTIDLPPLAREAWDQTVKLESQMVEFDFIDSGVPHIVLKRPPSLTGPLTDQKLKALASELRNHSIFHPQGANVTVVKTLGPGRLEAVTFERGVEDFTLACGTGAVAAAAWLIHHQPRTGAIEVKMPGGVLSVEFSGRVPRLTGPAQFVGTFQLDAEAGTNY